MTVSVQNELCYPLPQVSLTVLCGERQLAESLTDQAGCARVAVPLFGSVCVRAERAPIMEPQEVKVEIYEKEMKILLSCEICIQLMQLETAKELIVFCRDPRLDLLDAAPAIAQLQPFEGSVEYSSGEALKADQGGFLRSSANHSPGRWSM